MDVSNLPQTAAASTVTPLAIDLYCGLGGWTDGLLAEGYTVVGFDNERHVYGDHRYPAQLVLQDVRTLHGRQFKDVALIVASPPCQTFSYMAMPWSRAKRQQREYEDGTRDRKQLTELFDACFRIQREACEAAGRHIPLVVENVRGAQRWVGKSATHYGSFHLWGDVPALMPVPTRRKQAGNFHRTGAGVWNPGEHIGEGTKVSGLNFSNYGKPDYKPQAFNTTAEQRLRQDGLKVKSLDGGRRTDVGKGSRFTSRHSDGIRQQGSGRKAASAQIAKIPLPLARHIAQAWYPTRLG
jgi:C-5 cytosine-specific DNA methylase